MPFRVFLDGKKKPLVVETEQEAKQLVEKHGKVEKDPKKQPQVVEITLTDDDFKELDNKKV